VVTDVKEAEERPHPYEDSCGVEDHVNEDDQKLNTSTTKEKDKRCILIIGGIQIFFPISSVEASAQVAGEVEATGKPIVTVIGEKEEILKYAPIEE
jgi:hypothetical protein